MLCKVIYMILLLYVEGTTLDVLFFIDIEFTVDIKTKTRITSLSAV